MWRPSRLYFGPAGIPLSAKKRSTKEGIIEVKRLGLEAMEIEFVRGISLKPEAAKDIKNVAIELGIALTVHAPYYINLLSNDEDKVKASIERILSSAKIGYLANAWSVCFHAGYYQSISPDKAYEIIKAKLEEIVSSLEDEGIKIWIRPETTGKPSQFGTLNEVLKLSQELEMVMPVIDFAHLHARHKGKINSYEEFREILTSVEDLLGKEGLKNMHIHVSGIEYGDKGEKKHVNLKDSDLNYKDLIKVLREFKVTGVIISESPNLEEDALMLKDLYTSMS